MTRLAEFLNPLFAALELGKIPYAVCGNFECLPEHTDHDVDIWTSELDKFEPVLLTISERHRFALYLKNLTSNGANYLFYSEDEGPLTTVRIDVMNETSFRSIPLVSSGHIARNLVPFKNFVVVGPEVEAAMHFLYPLIASGRIRGKYKTEIQKFVDGDLFREILVDAFGKRPAAEVEQLIRSGDWDLIASRFETFRWKAFLLLFSAKLFSRIASIVRYVSILIRKVLHPSGLFIIFLGTDGSGKTTTIQELRAMVPSTFLNKSESYSFYWRPFLLPTLSALVGKTGERKEQTDEEGIRVVRRSAFLGIFYHLKFVYYWLDFVLGRLRIIPIVAKGGIVLFDRYYHDMGIYPERYGFSVGKGLMRVLRGMIPKPDIIFLLHCPPEVALARKRELSLASLVAHQQEIENALVGLSNVVRIQTTGSPAGSAAEVAGACVSFMSERIRKRQR